MSMPQTFFNDHDDGGDHNDETKAVSSVSFQINCSSHLLAPEEPRSTVVEGGKE